MPGANTSAAASRSRLAQTVSHFCGSVSSLGRLCEVAVRFERCQVSAQRVKFLTIRFYINIIGLFSLKARNNACFVSVDSVVGVFHPSVPKVR